MSEGSVTLRVSTQGILRFTAGLRRRYIGDDSEWAIVQAVGYSLTVRVWSTIETVLLSVPMEGYRAGPPFVRRVHNHGVDISRWLTPGNARSDEADDWTERGAVAVDADDAGDSVEATVETFDEVAPDV